MYPYSFPFFQRYYYYPIYSLSFHHLLGLIIFLLLRKVIGTSFQIFKLKIISGKKERQMIQIHAFKEKEKEGNEGRPQLGDQWKVPSLVALGKNPMLGGQWGSILFSGQWKVPSLVALGRNPMLRGQWGIILLGGQWKVLGLVVIEMFHVWMPLEGEGERKTFFSPPSTFYPIKFYLNLSSINFRVLFYHGSRPLLHVFPSFSLTYKLQSHISKYQVFHTLITKLILIFFKFISLNS
jgi:hypothetical protein